MIMFKSCPRCSGDRHLENDSDGSYITCLACGYVSYLIEVRGPCAGHLELEESA